MTATERLMYEDLEKSGIVKPAIIRQLQFKALEPDQTARVLGSKFWLVASYTIPYFGIDAKPMTWRAPSGKLIQYARFKLLGDVVGKKKKPIKYTQPKNSGIRLYLPPLLDWRAVVEDKKQSLLIAEGEKKSIAAWLYLDIPTIGLGGVSSFKTPDLDVLMRERERVEICYDGDPEELDEADEDNDAEQAA